MTGTFPFPAQPVTARRQLRKAVVAALENAALMVGTATVSVDSPGDWPYPQQKLPAVCVRSAVENKTGINKKNPNFTAIIELDVRAAVVATTGEAAQDDLESLWYQIERAILFDFYTLSLIQGVPTIESAVEIKAEGQAHFAGQIGKFRFETFETFDITAPAAVTTAPTAANPVVPLTEVTIDVTSPNSAPPFSEQATDKGLTITLPGG